MHEQVAEPGILQARSSLPEIRTAASTAKLAGGLTSHSNNGSQVLTNCFNNGTEDAMSLVALGNKGEGQQ